MSNDLGIDRSGNGNNWTVNNMAFADQVVDSPTNNFATGNPLITRVTYGWATLSEGNLQHTNTGISSSWGGLLPTMLPSTGKYYAEVYCQGNRDGVIGVINFGTFGLDHFLVQNPHFQTGFWGFYTDNSQGVRYDNGNNQTNDSNVTDFMQDKVMGIAIDNDNSKLFIYKNNTVIATINNLDISNTAATDAFAFISETADSTARTFNWNFGQDSSFAGKKTAQGNQDGNGIGDFYYTPPTGFLALCTSNLPNVAVVPSENFNTITYTGTDADNRAITGVGFQPDFAWFKRRNTTTNHGLFDVLRGANKRLSTNLTDAEFSDSNALMSFDSDGYTVSSDGTTNAAGTYVAWNWKANGSGSSNTDGSITSTVSANVDAGFSIVGYNGNQVGGATVGHGLSQAPEMVLIKQRTSAGHHWKSIMPPLGAGKALYLNLTNAEASGQFNNTLPTSTVFTLDTDANCNESGADHIAYAFHSVDGYSKVGSYTGNGNTDGTFVYTGFRPAFVMVKNATYSGSYWHIADSKRLGYNVIGQFVFPNTNEAESNYTVEVLLDLTSNGFKWRGNYRHINGSGDNIVFIAFAETPFKYSNAR